MTQETPRRGVGNQQVARAGRNLAISELLKRGARVEEGHNRMKPFTMAVSDADHRRTVYVRTKTKTRGDWQASIVEERPGPASDPASETCFWIFIDLGDADEQPRFWVVPNGWMLRDIYANHQAYLQSHGGQRARTLDSKHHAIAENRLTAWEGRWDLLGVFTVRSDQS